MFVLAGVRIASASRYLPPDPGAVPLDAPARAQVLLEPAARGADPRPQPVRIRHAELYRLSSGKSSGQDSSGPANRLRLSGDGFSQGTAPIAVATEADAGLR